MMVLDGVFHFALGYCNLSSSSLSLRLLFFFLTLRFLLVDDERMVIDDKKKKKECHLVYSLLFSVLSFGCFSSSL